MTALISGERFFIASTLYHIAGDYTFVLYLPIFTHSECYRVFSDMGQLLVRKSGCLRILLQLFTWELWSLF